MKTFRLPFLVSCLLPLVAGLRAAPVDSRLAAVTVYQDRAVVTRTAAVELGGGPAELVFANLPEALSDQSLQVSGRGTAAATILDVSAKRTYVDFTPNARVKELEDQLRELGRQQRGLDDQAAVLQSQRTMVDQIAATLVAPPAKDVPRPAVGDLAGALTFVTEQRAKIATDLAALDDRRADLQQKLAAVQAQLNELRGAGGKGYKTVTVRVAATQAGSLEIALSYTVPGASWAPNYDARVLAGERTVELGYFGLVRQNTGEDWKDVALTLSTARPSLGGAAPELSAWNLDIFLPRPMRGQDETIVLSPFQVTKDKRARNAPAPAATGYMADQAAEPLKKLDANLAQAAVESGATSATFKIAATTTVPSDNAPQKVPITAAKLAAQPEYATVPKRQAVAFLTDKVTNTSDFPLLGGAMNVFLDGTFVATSRLETVMPGEKFALALGADEGIAVKHKRVNKFTEDTGLTNSGRRITYEYLLTIQNNKKTAERIVVTDQLPVSRNEKIVVKQQTPAVSELKPDNEGLLKWTLDLKSGEKRELTVKFAIEFDKDVNVSGLE